MLFLKKLFTILDRLVNKSDTHHTHHHPHTPPRTATPAPARAVRVYAPIFDTRTIQTISRTGISEGNASRCVDVLFHAIASQTYAGKRKADSLDR